MARASKKLITFIALAIALASCVTLIGFTSVSNWVKIAFTGVGSTEYYMISAATDGSIWTVGRDGGDFYIANGTMNGGEWHSKVNTENFPSYMLIDDFYAATNELALASVYTIDDEGNLDTLKLCAVEDRGKKIETLLSIDCTGSTTAQQRESAGFGAFSGYGGKVYFVLNSNGESTIYALDTTELSVRAISVIETDGWIDSIILNDGKMALIQSSNTISIYSDYGVHQYDLEIAGNAVKLFAGDDSFYYLDSATNTVNEIGQMNDEYYLIQKIPVDSTLPMTVQPGGTTLWLENNQIFHYDGAPVEVKGILYESSWKYIGILAGICLVIAIIAYVGALILTGKRQVSMLVRSVLVMIFVMIIAGAGRNLVIIPILETNVIENAQNTVEAAAGIGVSLFDESDKSDVNENTANLVCSSLQKAGMFDAKVTIYGYASNGYTVISSTDPSLEAGTVVAGSGLILNAKNEGTVSDIKTTINGYVCEAVSSKDSYIMCVSINLSAVLETIDFDAGYIDLLLTIFQLFLCAVLFLLIMRVWSGVHRIVAGVHVISSGEYDVELVNNSGDELQDLAKAMNNMARELKRSDEMKEAINQNYMRFIPAETIKLLGVDRLEDVTRETVATHEMVCMNVSFDLPKAGLSSEQLFKEINEIAERTVFSAVAYGGNSFNFSYGTYNVVFESEYELLALQAALAIAGAFDALNKDREFCGKPPVKFKIAIDRGLVLMGMVGDELHMQPMAVTTCAERMIPMLNISDILDARITFTEEMVNNAGANNYRFVGNYLSQGNVEKLYELYDGDSYLVAKRKRETEDEFNTAIEAFYNGDYSQAKRILLQLARTGSGRDGSVRYYLNMADRLEQDPPEKFILNGEAG